MLSVEISVAQTLPTYVKVNGPGRPHTFVSTEEHDRVAAKLDEAGFLSNTA